MDKVRIVKNDYNISPSRYIHTGEVEEYRSIADVVQELNSIEAEAAKVNLNLKEILEKIGI